jgi:hypothetical protein
MSLESVHRAPALWMRLPRLVLLAALSASLAVEGCDAAGKPTTASLGGLTGSTSLTVSPPTATLAIGATLQLTATASAAALPLQWRSDRTDIAQVSATGLVTGVATGQAIITVASSNDTTLTATSSILVQ